MEVQANGRWQLLAKESSVKALRVRLPPLPPNTRNRVANSNDFRYDTAMPLYKIPDLTFQYSAVCDSCDQTIFIYDGNNYRQRNSSLDELSEEIGSFEYEGGTFERQQKLGWITRVENTSGGDDFYCLYKSPNWATDKELESYEYEGEIYNNPSVNESLCQKVFEEGTVLCVPCFEVKKANSIEPLLGSFED